MDRAVYCKKCRDKYNMDAHKLNNESKPILAQRYTGSAEAYGDMMQRIESLEERV